MNRLLVILSLLVVLPLSAQMTAKYTNEFVVFQRAQDLFEKEQYGAARQEFRAYIDNCSQKNDPTYIKALYYEAMSALELQQNDAVPMMEDFIRNYPENIFQSTIYCKLGLYYYNKKDFKTTVFWFSKLEKKDIPSNLRDEFYFKLGYAHFQLKKFTDARNAFYEVKGSKSQYGSPSLYYYSHISYQDKSFQTALDGFLKLKSENKYANIVPYYICQIYYQQGKYEEVTQFASTLTDSVSKANQRQVNQIIGDSYYKIGKYDEAAVYLENYTKSQKTSRSEDYQLGYSYFKSGNYDKAIKLFDKVAQTKDDMGQMALYHIGEVYMKKGDNAAARKAFEVCSTIESRPKVQEDALYNFAVLSYKLDVNPFNEAQRALTQFLTKYPNSERKNDVYEYLVNVYTQTSNYDEALKSLDKIAKMDIKLGSAYQIIAFNRGVELFLKQSYYKAIEAFEKVDKHPVDINISAKAKYWVSESYLLTDNFGKAISGYKSFLDFHNTYLSDLRADAYYNLGYAYLAKQDYQNVIESFKMYLQESKNKGTAEKKLDAYMRLADAYYVSKANDQAIRNYQEAFNMKMGYEDQALFFMAKTYGYKGDLNNKISRLENLIQTYSQSKYLLNSLYEIGLTYRLLPDETKASSYFERIVKEYPESMMVKDALIQMGDIYLKKDDFTTSENYYKIVLDKYSSNRNTCADAVKGLINLYKKLGQPERVESVVAQYDCAEFSKDEAEEIYYNTGLDPYLDSAYVKAIPALEKYIGKFPQGKYAIEVKSYLANAHFQLKHEDTAVKIYREILEGPVTDFSELAAIRVSRHFYNAKKYEEALAYYTKLENVTTKPDVIKNTNIGLMRCHFLLENWSNANSYSEKVLASQQLNPNVKLEAQFAKGISTFHIGKYAESRTALQWVNENTSTEFGAESRYYLAEIAYNEKDWPRTELAIQYVMDMKPQYDFWIAKAYLLQSKVNIEKNDLFKAEQDLNTIIMNYPHQEDGILSQAKQQLDELMQLKAPKVEDTPKVEDIPAEIEIDETQPTPIEEEIIEIQPENETK
jgi:tetratricopeptide (TPR) repeat protein